MLISKRDDDGGRVLGALRQRSVICYVHWTSVARNWVLRSLYDVLTCEGLVDDMYQWVDEGGSIDRVVERRPEWSDQWRYHYDLRIPIGERLLYIESRLDDEDDDDPGMSNTKMSQRSKSPRCPACGDRKMERHHEDHRTTIKHDGRAYEVCVPDLPVLRCAGCGEVIYGVDSNRRIDQALRHEIGVLSPDEIRSLRESVGLTQRALAELLGVAETSISRWESGAVIQSRSLDRLLRVFFTLPEVRKFMSRGCRRDQDDADSVLEIPSNQPSVDEGLARPQESSLFDEIFDEIRRGVADYATWSSGGRSRFHEYLESRDHRSIPSRDEDVLEAGRSRLSTREEPWWARRERQRERLARLWIENGLDLREAAHLKDLLDQLVDAATGRLDSEASLREAKAPGPVRQALLAWALLSGEETAILEAARGYLLAAREEPSIGGLSPADGEWIRGQAARLAPIGSAVMARLRSAEFSGV